MEHYTSFYRDYEEKTQEEIHADRALKLLDRYVKESRLVQSLDFTIVEQDLWNQYYTPLKQTLVLLQGNDAYYLGQLEAMASSVKQALQQFKSHINQVLEKKDADEVFEQDHEQLGVHQGFNLFSGSKKVELQTKELLSLLNEVGPLLYVYASLPFKSAMRDAQKLWQDLKDASQSKNHQKICAQFEKLFSLHSFVQKCQPKVKKHIDNITQEFTFLGLEIESLSMLQKRYLKMVSECQVMIEAAMQFTKDKIKILFNVYISLYSICEACLQEKDMTQSWVEKVEYCFKISQYLQSLLDQKTFQQSYSSLVLCQNGLDQYRALFIRHFSEKIEIQIKQWATNIQVQLLQLHSMPFEVNMRDFYQVMTDSRDQWNTYLQLCHSFNQCFHPFELKLNALETVDILLDELFKIFKHPVMTFQNIINTSETIKAGIAFLEYTDLLIQNRTTLFHSEKLERLNYHDAFLSVVRTYWIGSLVGLGGSRQQNLIKERNAFQGLCQQYVNRYAQTPQWDNHSPQLGGLHRAETA